MKHQLQEEFPERMNAQALHGAVAKTWNDVTIEELNDLLDNMSTGMHATNCKDA